MISRWNCLLVFFSTALSSPFAAGSPLDVVIDEINYDPFTGDDRDEYVEVMNTGPSPVDISGWTFSEGISFTFPSGTVLGPGRYLVVSPDASRARSHYGIEDVVGNSVGKLDQNGEIITLVNDRGGVISRVHYLDGETGVWPDNAAGLGPSLELVRPFERNDLRQNWASSRFLEGTPGRENSRFEGEHLGRTLVLKDGLWRTWKGLAEPSTPTTAWTGSGFDDGAWQDQKGPFGVGGAFTVNTPLPDMPGGYTTFYIRGTFDLDESTLSDVLEGALGLTLRTSYNDGFVAYLNGAEVARANLGSPGTPVPHGATAASSLGSSAASSESAIASGLLVARGNVLALQGARASAADADFLLGAELVLVPQPFQVEEARRTVVINEVGPSQPPSASGFIELYNRSSTTVDVGGCFLVDSRGSRFKVPSPRPIAKGSRLLFDETELGFAPSLSGARYALVEPDGTTFVNGMDPRPGPAGSSFGSFPDGNEDQYVMTSPTPGGPDQLVLDASVVVNEILYHPPFAAPSGNCTRQCSDVDQWIELHNRGASDRDIGDWSLSKGVDFTFPASTSISAGAYLVVAADRTRFLARYPAVDPAKVVGNWKRSLSRNTDTINLKDALGNRVDHVEYGDGGPTNDENPVDGVDDRTVASSDWPPEPDAGQGRTLELIHPSLDNRAGAAWKAGPAGGTPGARNSAYGAAPSPVVWDVLNSPVVPKSSQPVQVTCKVSSLSAVSKVEVLWHVEPLGAAASVTLLDDGVHGDGSAGDGTYGGTIPAQGNKKVVGFQVKATTADAKTALIPRPPAVAPYTGFKGPYFLYPVDDSSELGNGAPTFRVVMASADQNEIEDRDPDSNVLLPCTFIGDGKAYHTGGIRIRGKGSRTFNPSPWRVNLPAERKFRGVAKINLISRKVETDVLAADVFRRAGLPSPQEVLVNLVFQGTDHLYAMKEAIDGDFLKRHFGGSDGGDLYRGEYIPGPGTADWTYYGPTVNEEYTSAYVKQTNKEEDDYSGIIDLCRIFDDVQTPEAQFVSRLSAVADVEEWARFFAIQHYLSNLDGGIETNSGEDYFLYKVPLDSSRADAGKFLLLPWDIEETLSPSDDYENLVRVTLRRVRRFVTHPAFVSLYYASLLDLEEHAGSLAQMRKSWYLIDGPSASMVGGLESYVSDRDAFYDRNLAASLTAGLSAAAGQTLIKAGDVWRYFKGKGEPSGGNTNWTRIAGFSDASWSQGPTGIGYGDGDDATTLSDMRNSYTTVYCRKVFTVSDPAPIGSLSLVVDYDDGFVAYLNGAEVARKFAPGAAGSFVAFDDTASNNSTGGHEAGNAEKLDLTSRKGLLVAGSNILAIQVLNDTKGSSDLSLIPELQKTDLPGGAGCGETLYATTSRVTLSGLSNAGRTSRVLVNGTAAAFDPLNAAWSAVRDLSPGENPVKVEAIDAFGAHFDVLDLKVVRLARAFTSVGGTLSASTTWTSAGGPYLMTSGVIVPSGVKLSIGAGAIVVVQSGAAITVRGQLEALGTKEEPISFRPYACDVPLGGIVLDSTGSGAAAFQHHLRFLDLEFGDHPAGSPGTVSAAGSRLLIEDSSFRDTTAAAVSASSAQVEVRRTLFEEVAGGVTGTGSAVTVVDSTLSRMAVGADALSLTSGLGAARSRVERCVIERGTGRGIRLSSASADLVGNIVRDFEDTGISIEGTGGAGPPTITGNLIHDCGTGIALLNGAAVVQGDHNTVTDNRSGLVLSARGAADGGHGVFDSSIFWDNIHLAELDSRSSISLLYSDTSETWPGPRNISQDPRFSQALIDDFSLAPGSPAIQAGMNGTDMGAIPFGSPATFLRGDGDGSGALDLADVIAALDYLFRDAAAPACLDRLDSNDDAGIDISDPIYLLFFLFAGGQQPPLPYPDGGVDPTTDALPCR